MPNFVIVFAGGVGSRFDSQGVPKQFRILGDKPILLHTIEKFERLDCVDEIVLVVGSPWAEKTQELLSDFSIHKVSGVVVGGDTGHESRRLGLSELDSEGGGSVVFHDGVRPIIYDEDVIETFKLLESNDVVVSLSKVTSTPIVINGEVSRPEVLDRSKIFLGAAPQGAQLGVAKKMFERAGVPHEYTLDLLTIAAYCEVPIKLRDLIGPDFKLTHPSDWLILEGLLTSINRGENQ